MPQERRAGASRPCSSEQEHGDTCPSAKPQPGLTARPGKEQVTIGNALHGFARGHSDLPLDYASSTSGLSPDQSFSDPAG